MPPLLHPRFHRFGLCTAPMWLTLLLLTGCDTHRGDYGRFKTAPAGPDVDVTRSWAFILDGSPLPDAGAAPDAIAPLVSDILQLGPWPPQDSVQGALLDSAWSGFVRFEGTRVGVGGIDSVLDQTGRLDAAAAQLAEAFGRWRVHFPQDPVPTIDLAYTGFNYSAYPTDDLLLIGCEFFLGANHPAVLGLPSTVYPRYMQQRMVPEHLVGDALRGWLLVHFQEGHYDPQGRLAEELLYWGKVLYIARCLAPDLAPHDLLDWTEAEWAWAEANERAIWSELRNEETLYTHRRMDIQRWTSDAPFTKAGAIPQDSPDRIGWYIGLRWVEDHMARNADLDLPGVMAQQDVLPFLQTYRPGS